MLGRDTVTRAQAMFNRQTHGHSRRRWTPIAKEMKGADCFRRFSILVNVICLVLRRRDLPLSFDRMCDDNLYGPGSSVLMCRSINLTKSTLPSTWSRPALAEHKSRQADIWSIGSDCRFIVQLLRDRIANSAILVRHEHLAIALIGGYGEGGCPRAAALKEGCAMPPNVEGLIGLNRYCPIAPIRQ